VTRASRPIGVFDSGIGGLTIVRALRHLMPGEDIVYLGDTARVPYGTKSPETIRRYTLQAGSILQRFDPKLMVIACNTASANGLGALQAASACPVLGVIEPGAEAAAATKGPVGIMGTLATIQSGAYEQAIHRHNPTMEIHTVACPLLVSLAEEGWTDDPITDSVCRRYLNQLNPAIKTLVLGCTHYPVLLPSLRRVRPDVRWIESGAVTAQAVDRVIQGSLGYRTQSPGGSLRILLTDASSRLREVGERFMEEPLEHLELVEM
jgi:glutamate racemase